MKFKAWVFAMETNDCGEGKASLQIDIPDTKAWRSLIGETIEIELVPPERKEEE